jgi:transcriptional regulator with XRE-family HTH domain
MKEDIHPVDKIVGANIRRIRKLLGLSQEKLADQIAVTFQQVQKYENGGNRVSASRLYLIAGVLGVDVGELFKGLDDVRTNVIPLPELSAEAMRIAKDFQQIKSPKARLAIHNVVRTVIGSSQDDEAVAA